ncbi:TPA: hypothetical protein EYP66_07225 [Candidatus Poribacteria bacterium]|nr:hypothetical protein [Candidatus Poribacteria bacterium]
MKKMPKHLKMSFLIALSAHIIGFIIPFFVCKGPEITHEESVETPITVVFLNSIPKKHPKKFVLNPFEHDISGDVSKKRTPTVSAKALPLSEPSSPPKIATFTNALRTNDFLKDISNPSYSLEASTAMTGEGGIGGGLGGIKTNYSKNQHTKKQVKSPSFVLQKRAEHITPLPQNDGSRRFTSDILSLKEKLEKQKTTLKEEEDKKPADLSLVFVLARSDLTLGFTPLLKDYLSEYVSKIEAQGRSVACGMVVYSPANLYGAGIYSVSSDKERLRYLLNELDKIRGDEYDAFRQHFKAWRGDSRALDGLAVALEKNFFQSEAQKRFLFVTRNKVGDISDLQSSGFLRKYCPMSSLDEIIKKLRDLHIRVDVVGLNEQRARRLAKETRGRFSDVLLLEAGKLKP